MENGNNRTARSRGALMMYIFGIFMLVFYLGMAYMFLLYGVYRLYRQVKATDRDNE